MILEPGTLILMGNKLWIVLDIDNCMNYNIYNLKHGEYDTYGIGNMFNHIKYGIITIIE